MFASRLGYMIFKRIPETTIAITGHIRCAWAGSPLVGVGVFFCYG